MNNEASQSVPASVNNIFTHKPRPAIVAIADRHQRRFGANHRLPYDGVRAIRSSLSIEVFRRAALPHAELTVHLGAGVGGVIAALTPDALRELARRLIDAAADIEANPASALRAAATAATAADTTGSEA